VLATELPDTPLPKAAIPQPHLHIDDGAKLLKALAQHILVDPPRQVANEQPPVVGRLPAHVARGRSRSGGRGWRAPVNCAPRGVAGACGCVALAAGAAVAAAAGGEAAARGDAAPEANGAEEAAAGQDVRAQHARELAIRRLLLLLPLLLLLLLGGKRVPRAGLLPLLLLSMHLRSQQLLPRVRPERALLQLLLVQGGQGVLVHRLLFRERLLNRATLHRCLRLHVSRHRVRQGPACICDLCRCLCGSGCRHRCLPVRMQFCAQP
jgi:hypothetical protein